MIRSLSNVWRKLKWPFIFLAFFILVFCVWAWWITPYKEISILKNSRVKVLYESNQVSYSFTSQAPADWVDLDSVSQHAFNAIVSNEDHKFWEHEGLNYTQIRRALQDHYFDGKPLRGASTITQQLVKNLFLSPDRSLIRKLKEAIIAKELERQYSKERILELYLNIVEFGNQLHGLQPASIYYFNKRAADLTPREAAYLTSLLPNPRRYSKSFENGVIPNSDSLNIANVLYKMHKRKNISTELYLETRNQRLSFERRPLFSQDSLDSGNGPSQF